MNIRYTNTDKTLILTPETEFRPNLGWEENFLDYQKDILQSIINPLENYETVRYIHENYSVTIDDIPTTQCDIWYYFYFLNNQSPRDYDNGLDYDLIGISPKENAKLLKETSKSFFRLEFFTTPNRETQKLIFAKNLSLPLGQKVFDLNLKDMISIPVFNGNNFRNTENMYLFWFSDDSVISELTFYMSARFFNAEDGTVTRFLNKDLNADNSGLINGERVGTFNKPINFYEMNFSNPLDEVNDQYYTIKFRRSDHSYKILRGISS